MWTWVAGRGKDGRWVEGVGCGRGVLSCLGHASGGAGGSERLHTRGPSATVPDPHLPWNASTSSMDAPTRYSFCTAGSDAKLGSARAARQWGRVAFVSCVPCGPVRPTS